MKDQNQNNNICFIEKEARSMIKRDIVFNVIIVLTYILLNFFLIFTIISESKFWKKNKKSYIKDKNINTMELIYYHASREIYEKEYERELEDKIYISLKPIFGEYRKKIVKCKVINGSFRNIEVLVYVSGKLSMEEKKSIENIAKTEISGGNLIILSEDIQIYNLNQSIINWN